MTLIDVLSGRDPVVPVKLRPTDDELLAYWVDETPFMALQQYWRRIGKPLPIPDTAPLHRLFESEWKKRGC